MKIAKKTLASLRKTYGSDEPLPENARSFIRGVEALEVNKLRDALASEIPMDHTVRGCK